MKSVHAREFRGKWYFEAPDLDRMFELIVCAMTFPYGDKPGFAVFLGVEGFDRILRVAPAFWLDELEEHDHSSLFEKCCARVSAYSVSNLWVNTRNEDNRKLLIDWNRARDDQGLKRLNTQIAPQSKPEGSISYHLSALRERLKPERKTLFLSGESIIESALMDIGPADTPMATDTTNPVVAALCYAVVGLNQIMCDPYEDVDIQQGDDDYNVLGYMND